LPGAAEFDLRPLLDLVALGTIGRPGAAQVARSHSRFRRLERLSATQRPGLVALKEVAQCPPNSAHTKWVSNSARASMQPGGWNPEASLHLLLAREAACPALARQLGAESRAPENRTQHRRTTSPARYARGSSSNRLVIGRRAVALPSAW